MSLQTDRETMIREGDAEYVRQEEEKRRKQSRREQSLNEALDDAIKTWQDFKNQTQAPQAPIPPSNAVQKEPVPLSIVYVNDTHSPVEVRVNLDGCQPTSKTVDEGKSIVIFPRTNCIFVKTWDNGTILFQDRGISSNEKHEEIAK